MNSPKAPDSVANWTGIDIFLFSNGQKFSPPRKYHFKSDELNEWSALQSRLAHSQFGQMHSHIEIYTLNGRKIDGPLELMQDTAYVAVKPPDAFIQTGYEKYLLKASRSREKRQDKMNSNNNEKIDSTETRIGHLKSIVIMPNNIVDNNTKQSDNTHSLETATNFFPAAANNSITHSENKTELLHKVETTNKSATPNKPDLLQKEKLIYTTKNTILKKIAPLPAKNKFCEPVSSKRKNTSFSANTLPASINNKRLNTPLKNAAPIKENDNNIIDVDDIKAKSESEKNSTGKKEIFDRIIHSPSKEETLTSVSEKDLTVLSDVYKNTESDVQSLYIDADRKTALLSNDQKNLTSGLTKDNNSKETTKNSSKLNKVITTHSAVCSTELQESDSIVSNQAGIIKLNLNIDFNGCAVYRTFKSTKYKEVIKPERASQVDIDVTLSNDKLKPDNDVFLQDKSLESILANICEDKILDTNNKEVLVVHCKCDMSSYSNDDELSRDGKEGNQSYILLIPAQEPYDIFRRRNRETSKTLDKQPQQLQSCIRPPSIVNSDAIKKSENSTKHKVSISQEAPEQINSNNIEPKAHGDVQTFKLNEIKALKVDTFTQTDWCNILLQAIPQEDGRYTFHLPSLEVLKRYNINF